MEPWLGKNFLEVGQLIIPLSLSPGLYFVDPASVFLFNINHNRWLDVCCAEPNAPSFQQEKHIDISSTQEQPTGAGDFSALATLNMDLSEHRDWAGNECPDWFSLHHPSIWLHTACFGSVQLPLRLLHYNQTPTGLWPTDHEPDCSSPVNQTCKWGRDLNIPSQRWQLQGLNSLPQWNSDLFPELLKHSGFLWDSLSFLSIPLPISPPSASPGLCTLTDAP